MKKFMTIALAAALLFAVVGQVQAAATPLETSGELRVRLFYLDSYAGAVADNGKSNEFWDQRLRLTGKWQVAEAVKLEFRADILEGLWGDNSTTTTYSIVEDASANQTVVPKTAGVAPKDQIAFDRVFMVVQWPNSPITLTIGRQEASWGPGIASKADNRDRFKVTAALPFGTVGALYGKLVEVFDAHDTASKDDNRQYAAFYLGKAAGWNFGVLGSYVMSEATGTVDTNSNLIDVWTTGKAGPADISFEFAYNFGKNDYSDPAKTDVDIAAFGAYLGAFMPAGPVKVGVEAAYATGDDINTKDKAEGFRMDYHGPFWSVVLFNNMDLNGYALESTGNSSVGNAVAGKLTVVSTPMPNLTLTGALVYAQRLEDTAAGKADPLGTEVDLICTYAITPNVSWTVGAGYLMVGNYYKAGGKAADDALAATSQFVLKF